MADDDIQTPTDLLNKLSAVLVQVSRGDPLVALRNELGSQFRAIESRFLAIDKATELQHEDQVRVPTQIDKAVIGLRDVLEQMVLVHISKLNGKLDTHISATAEKFTGVGAQFSERDTRTDQRAGDTKLAVDAAFAAAKEATAKIEAGFTKQIDGMTQIIDTKTGNIDGNLSDLKDRVTALESRSGASTDNRREARDNTGLIVGALGLIVAVGTLLVLIFERMPPR
jgi:hypothetical protein